MKLKHLTYVVAGLVVIGVCLWGSSKYFSNPKEPIKIETKKKGAGEKKRRRGRRMFAKKATSSISVNQILMTTTKKKFALQ